MENKIPSHQYSAPYLLLRLFCDLGQFEMILIIFGCIDLHWGVLSCIELNCNITIMEIIDPSVRIVRKTSIRASNKYWNRRSEFRQTPIFVDPTFAKPLFLSIRLSPNPNFFMVCARQFHTFSYKTTAKLKKNLGQQEIPDARSMTCGEG